MSCSRTCEAVWLEAHAAQEQVLATGRSRIWPGPPRMFRGHRGSTSGSAALTRRETAAPGLLAERGDVLERDLGVEPAGEHPVVLVDELIRDVDVVELEAWKLRLVGVGLGVEPTLGAGR